MTGEITLRGRVLPIGGLKEKILAAHRAGITTVIIPKENGKDLRDIPKRVLKAMRIVPVEHMDEVLRVALVLPDPENFLKGGSVAVDWRQPLDRRDKDRREESSRFPVASAVPPPSALDELPASDREPPSDSPLEDRLPRPTPSTDIGYPTPEPAIREE